MASCGKGLSEMEKLSGPTGCQVFPASIALMRRMNGVGGGWRVEGRVRDNEFFRNSTSFGIMGTSYHPMDLSFPIFFNERVKPVSHIRSSSVC